MLLFIIITSLIALGIITQAIIHIFNLQDEANLVRMKKETEKQNQTNKHNEQTNTKRNTLRG